MYEEHFGLTRRPFSVKARGTDVFVGPQTAKTMAGFRKALTAQDAVVTVSGPVGTGKTTLVERALDAIGSKYKTIRVGRMQLNASDVLESLLIVLGIQDRPAGTIQRFAALRKKLKHLQDASTRVFILVEDAMRTGAETLAELEALTVADAGESDGASIILMGDERLFDFMKDPQLARLQQRVRQRHRIMPLCAAEMRGYLKHSFRTAGADYEQVFDPRSAELLHRLSDGIPRVANTLVESVLTAAAEKKLERIEATFIAEIASEEFGLSVDDFDFATPGDASSDDMAGALDSVVAPAAVAPAADPAVAPEVDANLAFATGPTVDPSPRSGLPDDTAGQQEEPDSLAGNDERSAAAPEDIPELVHDTLPDLAILSKRYATLSRDEFDDTPTSRENIDSGHDSDGIPELQPVPADGPAPAAEIIPELQPEPDSAADAAVMPPAASTSHAAASSTAGVHPEPGLEMKAEDQPAATVVPELEPESGAAPEPSADIIPELEPCSTGEAGPAADVAPATERQTSAEAERDAEILPELEPETRSEVARMPELAAGLELAPKAETQKPADVVPDAGLERKTAAEPVARTEPESEPASSLAAEQDLNLLLALQDEAGPHPLHDSEPAPGGTTPAPESVAAPVPDFDRDPTLAELKPDLEALEQAMAYAHGTGLAEPASVSPEAGNSAELADSKDDIPEITLDKSIETGIQNKLAEPARDDATAKGAPKREVELDRVAANIANAKTIDDIDDIMAETLFGTGISMIAAALKANPPGSESANDELQLVAEPAGESAPAPVNAPAPAVNSIREEISLETPVPGSIKGLDPTASQRLRTVRALNADMPAPRPPRQAPPADRCAPQTIEDQINTSITQTLKALEVPQELDDDDEPTGTGKSGFFSRFRRSQAKN